MTPPPSGRPGAALAHAVVATGLADPERLRSWRDQPALLATLGLAPGSVDLDALADFAGLSEKIRHNQCRIDLPLTFRLLLLTGLEIALFRDYAPRSLARRRLGRTSTRDRLNGLLEFVEAWAPPTDPDRCLVRDVLRHEHAIATLRDAADPPATAGSDEPDRTAVPRPHGHLVVHRLTCDPRQVGQVLRDRDPDLGRIERGSWTLGYHRPPGRPPRMLEVEHPVGELLRAVDGRRDPGGIAAALLGDAAATDHLLAALTQLTELGLLRWHSGTGAAPCD